MFRMMTISAILALSTLSTMSAVANDKDGIYVTVGGTFLSSELDLTNVDIGDQATDLGTEDVDAFIINGRIGYRFNDYFAVEGELGFGTGGDEIDRVIPLDVDPIGTLNVDTNVALDVENYYVGFARGILPVSEQFDLFVRVGYGEANADADVIGNALGFTAATSVSQSESGLAYGVGGQFNFTENDGIRADYTRLDDTDIISLAYARRF